jgi:chromosome segregation protein
MPVQIDTSVKGREYPPYTVTVERGRLKDFARAIGDTNPFSDFFTTFFGGGNAELLLTKTDEHGLPGVDIVAQPPRKKVRSIQLLSGGERSLTALALLFALLQTHPSPICVLDEVDAALDEANVDRFTAVLSELAERTQFIIVTHNRRTMEMAPVLYGVTMQEPGVSKLVSVRWEETATPEEKNAKAAVATNAA